MSSNVNIPGQYSFPWIGVSPTFYPSFGGVSCDEEVEELPPIPVQEIPVEWVSLQNMQTDDIYFIEAKGVQEAFDLAYDEFGVQSDDGQYVTVKYTDLQNLLNLNQLEEVDFGKKHSVFKYYVRYGDRRIVRSERDGMDCCGCSGFFPYSIANLPGGKMKCFSCRTGF